MLALVALVVAEAAGDHTKGVDSIPLLVEDRGREVAVYVEAGPWDAAKVEDFLKWTALLQLRWVPYERFGPDNAQTLARLAQEYLGRELTLDLKRLHALDALIVEDLGSAGHPVLPATHRLAGSFFGEALIALYGGDWVVQGDRASDISVRVTSPRGEAEANVFGKIAKLVRNGIEDSTAAMAESIGRA